MGEEGLRVHSTVDWQRTFHILNDECVWVLDVTLHHFECGAYTYMHGHPGGRCYTLVLSGIFREWIARLDGRDTKRTRYPGAASVIDDCIGAHALYSPTGGVILNVFARLGNLENPEGCLASECCSIGEPTYLSLHAHPPLNAVDIMDEIVDVPEYFDDAGLHGFDVDLLGLGASDAEQ